MNTFRHRADGIIEINGEEFELKLFTEVEPEYSLPEGCVSRFYDGEQQQHILYTKESQSAGELPWEDGERYLTRIPDLKLMQDMIKDEEEYIASFKKSGDKEPTRVRNYPPINKLVVAMWEHFVEGRPAEETINIVQEKRLKVKEKYPK